MTMMILITLQDSIKPAGLGLPNLSESSLAGGFEGERSEPSHGRVERSEAADRQAKLNSEKFGDEAGDQTGGFI